MEDNILEITIESYSYFDGDEYICGEYLIVNGDKVESNGFHLKSVLDYLKYNDIGNLEMDADCEDDLEEVLESIGYDVIVNRI